MFIAVGGFAIRDRAHWAHHAARKRVQRPLPTPKEPTGALPHKVATPRWEWAGGHSKAACIARSGLNAGQRWLVRCLEMETGPTANAEPACCARNEFMTLAADKDIINHPIRIGIGTLIDYCLCGPRAPLLHLPCPPRNPKPWERNTRFARKRSYNIPYLKPSSHAEQPANAIPHRCMDAVLAAVVPGDDRGSAIGPEVSDI